MANLAEFFQDLIDDASDTVARIQREGEHLRELKARADFGLRVLGDVAKTELETAFGRVADRLAEIAKR